MKFIILGLLFCVTVNTVPQGLVINEQLNDEWDSYKIKFVKKYESLVEITRRLIWEENLKYIQQHNLEYDLGKHSYYLGLNEFSDMTNEEFRENYLKFVPNKENVTVSDFLPPENMGSLPVSVDWRKEGFVTPVKNQGQCGSCWSFSSTGALEGQYFRKTKSLVSFSEQQLVDCSQRYGNHGCDGGLMDNAFQYVHDYGIERETDYPYTATVGPCRYNASKVVTHCYGIHKIPRGNEITLALALATQGPIAVAIDASKRSFQSYKGGIYDEFMCSTTALDHAVLAVGYGVENLKKYWLVKNSWGTTWGLSGYIKMSKDKRNQCGIASMASYPLI